MGNPARIPAKQLGITLSNIVYDGVPCNANVFVGAIVRMDEDGVAQLARADAKATANIIGVCEFKAMPDSELCSLRVLGITKKIFTGLDVELNYFLSETVWGGMQTTPPTTAGHVMIRLGQPFSSQELLFIKGDMVIRG